MLEKALVVKCPLCEGKGELPPQSVVDQFSSPELRRRLDARIAEIAELCDPQGTQAGRKTLNFQKEVHTWNPASPIWRRSPKE
jgi:hypothetical protein